MDFTKVKSPFPPSYGAEPNPKPVESTCFCPEFKEYRRQLNAMQQFRSYHQRPDLVTAWSIPPSSHTPQVIEDKRSVIYIDTCDKLRCMITHLQTHDEIALDAEFGQSLFHDCISIFQISCTHSDYVIDDFVMFPFVKELEIYL
jgi:hypothetical protein